MVQSMRHVHFFEPQLKIADRRSTEENTKQVNHKNLEADQTLLNKQISNKLNWSKAKRKLRCSSSKSEDLIKLSAPHERQKILSEGPQTVRRRKKITALS